MEPVNCTSTTFMRLEEYWNPLDPDQRMGFATIFCIFAAASLLGNVWTLISTTKRVYQTLYKCCLLSLAVSDLIIAVFVSLDNVMRLITPNIEWQLGPTLCRLLPLLTTAAVLASAFTLTCVAVDRYQGLAWLYDNFKPNLTASIAIMFVIWGVAFGASVQMFFIYTPIEYGVLNISNNNTFEFLACSTLCLADSANYPNYFTGLFATIFIPLLMVFLTSYGMIALRVWGRAKRQAARSAHTPSTITSTTETGTSTVTRVNSPKTAPHIQKKLRTFRVVLIIMATFVICRLPQWSYNLFTLQTNVNTKAGFVIKYSLSALTVFNTAINPLLYAFLDSVLDFKFKCLSFFGIRRQ